MARAARKCQIFAWTVFIIALPPPALILASMSLP